MPNYFAYMMLLLWPVISVFIFNRFKTSEAVVVNIIAGYLLMPVGVSIDLPLIPPLDKESILALTSLVGARATFKGKITLLPSHILARTFTLVLLCIPLINVFTNSEMMFNGRSWIQSLSLYDGLSAFIGRYLSILPFILGIQVLRTDEERLFLFKAIVIGALLYSVLVLFEIRMSPQLHTWVYGFFPHSFGQQVRFGGFRAVVFLGHGLTVALFLFIALGSATILTLKSEMVMGLKATAIVFYLLIVLILSKSVAPIIYSILFIIAVKLLMSKTMLFSRLLMMLVIAYPLLSILQIFPHDALLELADLISSDRAQSLGFRFYNETLLLEHALQKPILGWGGWGRNLLAGSTIDGTWIIIVGVAGFIGFITFFGLPYISVYHAGLAYNTAINKMSGHLLAAHALLVTLIMVDQLPNSSMKGYIWLIIGSLLGGAIHMINESKLNNTPSSVAIRE